jgi:group I intron endonuclease
MARKAFIYKIINPVGKIYIGSTYNLYDRQYRYKNAKLGQQIKIKNSILKYGWNSHYFEVIHECNEFDRNKWESFYGKKYDVLGENGLNLSLPKGDTNYPAYSDSTKLKIGLAHKGKSISDEQKLKMSISLKETFKERGHPSIGRTPWNKGKSFLVGKKNPMFGVRRSDEWKLIQSERAKKRGIKGSLHPCSKIVIDTYTGVFYESLGELCKLIGVNYSTLRCKLNGTQRNNTQYKYA